MRPFIELDDLAMEFANKLQISRDRLAIQTGSKGGERHARARRRQARLAIEHAGLVLDRYNSQEDAAVIEKTDAEVLRVAVQIQTLVIRATAAELDDDTTTLGELRDKLAGIGTQST